MKYLQFLLCLPLMLLAVACDGFHTFVLMLTGPAPRMQSVVILLHHWKELRGVYPTKAALACEQGYLYQKVTYSDGSSLLFRE